MNVPVNFFRSTPTSVELSFLKHTFGSLDPELLFQSTGPAIGADSAVRSILQEAGMHADPKRHFEGENPIRR